MWIRCNYVRYVKMSISHYGVNNIKQDLRFQIFRSRFQPVPLLIVIMLAASSMILANHYVGKTYGQPETNFPPPIFYKLRSEPSYVK